MRRSADFGHGDVALGEHEVIRKTSDLLLTGDVLLGDGDHGVACDAGEDDVLERRGDELDRWRVVIRTSSECDTWK